MPRMSTKGIEAGLPYAGGGVCASAAPLAKARTGMTNRLRIITLLLLDKPIEEGTLSCRGCTLDEVASTHRDVTIIAADLGLGAFAYRLAISVDAHVHRRLAAAFAHGFDL